MIIHIALFRWKEGTTNDQIKNVLQSIRQLKSTCHGIEDIYCGKNYHKESRGFTHGVVVIAESQQALDTYRKHPNHKIIAEHVARMEEDGLGFDFEA